MPDGYDSVGDIYFNVRKDHTRTLAANNGTVYFEHPEITKIVKDNTITFNIENSYRKNAAGNYVDDDGKEYVNNGDAGYTISGTSELLM